MGCSLIAIRFIYLPHLVNPVPNIIDLNFRVFLKIIIHIILLLLKHKRSSQTFRVPTIIQIIVILLLAITVVLNYVILLLLFIFYEDLVILKLVYIDLNIISAKYIHQFFSKPILISIFVRPAIFLVFIKIPSTI